MSAKQWFSFDPCDGFEFHETEEQAKRKAEASLDGYRSDAVDGWDEEVVYVCWGSVNQRVCCTVQTPRPPSSELDPDGYDKNGVHWGDFDEMLDFELRDTEVSK